MSKPEEGGRKEEQGHFDALVAQQGETWWGSNTYAGRQRLCRRAKLLTGILKREYSDPQVVEIGCGTGAFSRYCLEEMPALRLQGLDISPKAAEEAERRLDGYANASFRAGDALALELEDESVHAVVGVSILHHVPLEPCLSEICRVLRPGGLCWFSEPNMLNPQIMLEKNVRPIGKILQNTPGETAFFRWSLAKTLKDLGFGQVSVRPFDFLHPLVPKPLTPLAATIGKAVELIPVIREFAGSHMIVAFR